MSHHDRIDTLITELHDLNRQYMALLDNGTDEELAAMDEQIIPRQAELVKLINESYESVNGDRRG
ncbi:hypothetical protein CATRI_00085 [Corynebacterium atrinae]|uniref:hypothetical protein n=1 Tax=Corynebacterium atrinae TaxID=1336740 RepID=UPI0025B525DF|nr:hypothetical protein [Corynebacterium atrinae]WJY62140.1 hypothetical protein CATRI_00085 [Corynebacterium atrinae]